MRFFPVAILLVEATAVVGCSDEETTASLQLQIERSNERFENQSARLKECQTQAADLAAKIDALDYTHSAALAESEASLTRSEAKLELVTDYLEDRYGDWKEFRDMVSYTDIEPGGNGMMQFTIYREKVEAEFQDVLKLRELLEMDLTNDSEPGGAGQSATEPESAPE